jgi:hypothetical protein
MTKWEQRKNDPEALAARNERLQARRRAKAKVEGPPTWVKIGATVADFQSFWDKQGGKCGICGNDLEPMEERTRGKVTHFDHCHETGKLRGLLCFSCNSKLGFYEKHKERILAYLKESTSC